MTFKKKGNQLVTDLYVKLTDTNQYQHASSVHFPHCKKSIPFSQALHLNWIFSENAFFDKGCNDLEVWLKEWGYSDKLVRGQILNARKCLRSEVWNKQKSVGSNNKFVFNITHHQLLSKLKNVLSDIHLPLTPDREHGKVFERIPIVGFRIAKSLKSILVRVRVASLEKKKGSCRSCGCTRRKICEHVVTTETFRSFSTQREYCIKPDNLNCRSNNVVYLFHAKHVLNNTQVVRKVSDLDLTITGISLKGILSNKCHFMLILRMINMVLVIGKLLSLTKQTV